jgi:hypothetical protein
MTLAACKIDIGKCMQVGMLAMGFLFMVSLRNSAVHAHTSMALQKCDDFVGCPQYISATCTLQFRSTLNTCTRTLNRSKQGLVSPEH